MPTLDATVTIVRGNCFRSFSLERADADCLVSLLEREGATETACCEFDPFVSLFHWLGEEAECGCD